MATTKISTTIRPTATASRVLLTSPGTNRTECAEGGLEKRQRRSVRRKQLPLREPGRAPVAPARCPCGPSPRSLHQSPERRGASQGLRVPRAPIARASTVRVVSSSRGRRPRLTAFSAGDVFARGLDPQGVASEWISQYEQDNAEALRALVNFVLKASGCSLEITVHDVEDQDNVTGKVSDLQDEYQAVSVGRS